MRTPVSTYRLQIRPSFDLVQAAQVLQYIRDLGADWVYLSPLLKAEAGSDHGYDVVDHSRVDPERGGSAGLATASDAARSLGLGVLIDIVPNHVGISTPKQNGWWWDLLSRGQESRYADAFDIDWEFGGGKVRIPVLGDDEGKNSALDDLVIAGDELHYFDNHYPIAAGTGSDGASAREVHSRQNYELINWRRADAELNYRRFFAVNTLAGIRVETPWVFDESHSEIVRWITAGLADGLRVDHPDGLADPGEYLDRLAAATGGTYVLVEKILEGDEQLPTAWAAAGTTGYDALADIDRILIDPGGRRALDLLDSRLRDQEQSVSWPTLIHGTKRVIADGILRSEVLRIERDFGIPVAPATGISSTADAIAELLACFPVYRSYLPLGEDQLREAGRIALLHRRDLSHELTAVLAVLADPEHPAARRFQQTSGMVMAKGVEDTAFYRYTRLGSLTEVGADPSEFSIRIGEFHRRQQVRQASFPSSLTTLSTHDTKRGEDVRARINVLSEIPIEWEEALQQLRNIVPLGDGPLEALLWEAIVGAWPASRARLKAYAEKAAREAGNSTKWTAPREQFEERMRALIDSAFDNPAVTTILGRVLDAVRLPGWSNSLSAKLVQLAAPGVPDVYQGSELWETSLVDPDNRRAVDFDERRRILAAIDAGATPPVDESGAAKLLVTSRALRLRRDFPQFFTRYAPVTVFGPSSTHAIAFDRGEVTAVATRLPVGLAHTGGWHDTTIRLRGRAVRDVISGREFDGSCIALADLLAQYPVALLAPLSLLEAGSTGRDAVGPDGVGHDSVGRDGVGRNGARR